MHGRTAKTYLIRDTIRAPAVFRSLEVVISLPLAALILRAGVAARLIRAILPTRRDL